MSGAAMHRTAVSRQAALEESFFLGLRLNRGVNLRELATKLGETAVDNACLVIAELLEGELMERVGDFVSLTSRGRLLSNEVFERFILADGVAR
jgi:oxygen-independent coproporphyrinogen-3 oxidase